MNLSKKVTVLDSNTYCDQVTMSTDQYRHEFEKSQELERIREKKRCEILLKRALQG